MKIFVSTFILLITGIFYTQAQKSELDGKTFHIKLKLIDGKRVEGSTWLEDEITFKGGNLKLKDMSRREKFPPAHCEIKADPTAGEKTIAFSASHNNPFGSDIKWDGTVTGNSIKGTAVWTNIHGPRTYSFSGTAKGK